MIHNEYVALLEADLVGAVGQGCIDRVCAGIEEYLAAAHDPDPAIAEALQAPPLSFTLTNCVESKDGKRRRKKYFQVMEASPGA